MTLEDMPTEDLASELRVWADDVHHLVARELMIAAAERLSPTSVCKPEKPDAG